MYDRTLVNCVNNIAQINNDCVPINMTSPDGKKHDIPMSNKIPRLRSVVIRFLFRSSPRCSKRLPRFCSRFSQILLSLSVSLPLPLPPLPLPEVPLSVLGQVAVPRLAPVTD